MHGVNSVILPCISDCHHYYANNVYFIKVESHWAPAGVASNRLYRTGPVMNKYEVLVGYVAETDLHKDLWHCSKLTIRKTNKTGKYQTTYSQTGTNRPFPWVYSGQNMRLTTHRHDVPTSWMERSYTSTVPICHHAFTFTFYGTNRGDTSHAATNNRGHET
jgi:hypothetical protein